MKPHDMSTCVFSTHSLLSFHSRKLVFREMGLVKGELLKCLKYTHNIRAEHFGSGNEQQERMFSDYLHSTLLPQSTDFKRNNIICTFRIKDNLHAMQLFILSFLREKSPCHIIIAFKESVSVCKIH